MNFAKFLRAPFSPNISGRMLLSIELGPSWYQIGNKTSYIPKVLCTKNIPMLTGLRVLCLACKRVFYRPEHNVKGRPQGRSPLKVEMKYTNG